MFPRLRAPSLAPLLCKCKMQLQQRVPVACCHSLSATNKSALLVCGKHSFPSLAPYAPSPALPLLLWGGTSIARIGCFFGPVLRCECKFCLPQIFWHLRRIHFNFPNRGGCAGGRGTVGVGAWVSCLTGCLPCVS